MRTSTKISWVTCNNILSWRCLCKTEQQDNTIYIFLRESLFLTSDCPILLGWVVFTNIIVTLLDRWWMMNLSIHLLGYVNTWKQDRLKWLEINVREPQRCNHEWTIQKTWQHWLHKTRRQMKRKQHNKIHAWHHYPQATATNVNKAWSLLQTTGGNRTSFPCGNPNGHHIMGLRT